MMKMITDPIFYLRKNPDRYFTTSELAQLIVKSHSTVTKKLKKERDKKKIKMYRDYVKGISIVTYKWNEDYKIKKVE